MKLIADLQIHSKYARATSRDISLQNLEKFGRIKGLDVLGTGDVLHPKWLKELKENLREDGSGILTTKTGYSFVLQGEVSNIFHQDGKLRKIHNLILAKNFDIADQMVDVLGKKGNLAADGRPIFGKYSCMELVDDLISIDKSIEIIPAHVMTPWFGLFGSKSGFDSVEDCFKEKSKHIHAIETGMSADPPMLWRVSKWNRYALVSSSDSHSHWPWRIGREATMFDLKEISYDNIINAIRTQEGLEGTIEVYPAYGKYHWDGHRNCKVSFSPRESAKFKNICPVCKRQLTIGVDNRIEELADKPVGFRPQHAKAFVSIIPLSEIITRVMGVNQLYSKSVWEIYNKLIERFGSEFNVLLNADMKEIEAIDDKIAKAVIDLREGRVDIEPGYDGEYGQLLFDSEEKHRGLVYTPKKKQKALTDY